MESLVIRCVIVVLLAGSIWKYEAWSRQPDLSENDDLRFSFYGCMTALLGGIVGYTVLLGALQLVVPDRAWLYAFVAPGLVTMIVLRVRMLQQRRERELWRRMAAHRRWHERMGNAPWRPGYGEDDDDT